MNDGSQTRGMAVAFDRAWRITKAREDKPGPGYIPADPDADPNAHMMPAERNPTMEELMNMVEEKPFEQRPRRDTYCGKEGCDLELVDEYLAGPEKTLFHSYKCRNCGETHDSSPS